MENLLKELATPVAQPRNTNNICSLNEKEKMNSALTCLTPLSKLANSDANQLNSCNCAKENCSPRINGGVVGNVWDHILLWLVVIDCSESVVEKMAYA